MQCVHVADVVEGSAAVVLRGTLSWAELWSPRSTEGKIGHGRVANEDPTDFKLKSDTDNKVVTVQPNIVFDAASRGVTFEADDPVTFKTSAVGPVMSSTKSRKRQVLRTRLLQKLLVHQKNTISQLRRLMDCQQLRSRSGYSDRIVSAHLFCRKCQETLS